MTITPGTMNSLREALADWKDRDVAAFWLATILGIFESNVTFAKDAKHVFWSDNRLGSSLEQVLKILTSLGALEEDEERERLRWNPKFNWRECSIDKSR
jgi:hypothetical protein